MLNFEGSRSLRVAPGLQSDGLEIQCALRNLVHN